MVVDGNTVGVVVDVWDFVEPETAEQPGSKMKD
jgi:hypothetical protein